MIVEWTDSGESEWEWIAPLHVHHADDEAWYVLEGVLRLRIGDKTYRPVLVAQPSRRRERPMPTATQGAAKLCATCL